MSGLEFLDAAARQAGVAARRADEPGGAAWAQAETRSELLLAHWSVDPSALARELPPELEPERFDGACWVGLAAYRVSNRRLRGLPPLPGLAAQRAVELRTYVGDGERTGIWLLSLELSSRLLAEASKRSHRLPAYHARVELDASAAGGRVEVERDGGALAASYLVSAGRARRPAAGSLAAFATTRDLLFTADGGRLYRAELRSSPLLARPARVLLERSSLARIALAPEAAGIVAGAHDVVLWPLEEQE